MRKYLAAFVLVASMAGCITPMPPVGLYTPQQTQIYVTETPEQAVLTLSKFAITQNEAGKLSDHDTVLVRDFALAFDAWRVDYTSGASTSKQVIDLLNGLVDKLSTGATTNTLKAVLASLQTAIAGVK